MGDELVVRLREMIAPSYYGLHRDVKEHRYTHFLLEGGRGSGKSSFVAIEVMLLMLRHPKLHAAVLRKVASTIRSSVYPQYLWAADQLGMGGVIEARVSPPELINRVTGQRILFFGADNADKLKSVKTRGGYLGITHFEERDQFDGRDEIRRILQSTMRGGEHFWNFETNNPPISTDNWANRDARQERPDRVVHRSCYRDLPEEWLGRPFVREAEHLADINPRAFRHEYLGEAVGSGFEVFDNLRLEAVSDEEIAGFGSGLRGVDWGYWPDPFAYVRVHYDAEKMVLTIFDELTLYRAGNEESAAALRKKGVQDGELVIADSAEPKSIADFRSYGLWCRPAQKKAGSVAYSMKWLQRLQAIVIDPERCPDTAREFSGYSYLREAGGGAAGYPDKDNHHIDAVRYALWPVWREKGY